MRVHVCVCVVLVCVGARVCVCMCGCVYMDEKILYVLMLFSVDTVDKICCDRIDREKISQRFICLLHFDL